MRRRDEGASVAHRDSGSASPSVTTALRSRQRVVSRGLNVEVGRRTGDHAMQDQPRAGRRNTTKPRTARATGAPVVTRGGYPLVPEASASPAAFGTAAPLIGKRYVNTSDTLKPPCTRRGENGLGFDGAPHDAKPSGALPAAD
jgi:hypothetical protein